MLTLSQQCAAIPCYSAFANLVPRSVVVLIQLQVSLTLVLCPQLQLLAPAVGLPKSSVNPTPLEVSSVSFPQLQGGFTGVLDVAVFKLLLSLLFFRGNRRKRCGQGFMPFPWWQQFPSTRPTLLRGKFSSISCPIPSISCEKTLPSGCKLSASATSQYCSQAASHLTVNSLFKIFHAVDFPSSVATLFFSRARL